MLFRSQARSAAQAERHRPGFDDTVWFRMDIGRRQNADPRWLLPLLCRRGHITRNEIGAIRIGMQETHFQVPRGIAAKFSDALKRTAGAEGEDAVTIEPAPSGPEAGTRGDHGAQPMRRHSPGPPKGPRPPANIKGAKRKRAF